MIVLSVGAVLVACAILLLVYAVVYTLISVLNADTTVAQPLVSEFTGVRSVSNHCLLPCTPVAANLG